MEDILYQFNPWWDSDLRFPGIPRIAYLDKMAGMERSKDVVLVTGLRRVGKTTLLYQFIHQLIERVDPNKILYVSMDNLALKDHSILDIFENYRRIHSLRHNVKVYLFLDEVHFQKDYELQLKNLYDSGYCKIYASGSASLDIVMRSPYLTGRQRIFRLNPLDFSEFLRFTGNEITMADKHLYPSLAAEYVNIGGMPEYVKTKDPNVLQSLVDSILFRDIAGRHNIRDRENLKDILILIAQSVSSPVSKRRISRILGIKENTVSKILNLFIESNLIHTVEKAGKVSERKASPQKIYLADTGLFSVLTEHVNLGARVENLLYLTLAKTGTVRYHRFNGQEVDFIVKKSAFESKYKNNITNDDLKNLSMLKGYKQKTAITDNYKGKLDGIDLVPLWKYLLDSI